MDTGAFAAAVDVVADVCDCVLTLTLTPPESEGETSITREPNCEASCKRGMEKGCAYVTDCVLVCVCDCVCVIGV